ncbi:MAG: DUF664 domain-containing protein [Deltaproteobacteria bacterium]|nr:DUF664 domain-containing protein [Deltaproteobacteria bacterium]MBW2306330.1 DUF664 domain-containing protein [Deltaproteobacteria bacterium]
MTNEIQTYLQVLNELRHQVKRLLEGLPQEALDWRPIHGEGDLATNSLAVMAAHLAGAESFWMKEVIGAQPIQRDRDAEFVTKGRGISELEAMLEAARERTEDVLTSLELSQLDETREVRNRTVTVRWSILHVIEHTAMHVGHMQLTRQLWMAGQ